MEAITPTIHPPRSPPPPPPLPLSACNWKFSISIMKPHNHRTTTLFIIDDKPRPFKVELTVVSAEGLDAAAAPVSCCPFPRRRRLRPFAAVTTTPPDLWGPQHDGSRVQEYVTGVDSRGGENPSWGKEFSIPVGPDFFANAHSCLYLCVYDARSGAGGRGLLGWCRIPVEDFGVPPTGAVRQLSYGLKERDDTRGKGIVNLAVRVEGPLRSERLTPLPSATCRPVIGIPMGLRQRSLAGRWPTANVSAVPLSDDDQNQWRFRNKDMRSELHRAVLCHKLSRYSSSSR